MKNHPTTRYTDRAIQMAGVVAHDADGHGLAAGSLRAAAWLGLKVTGGTRYPDGAKPLFSRTA